MTELIGIKGQKAMPMEIASDKRQVHVERVDQSPFNDGDSLFPGQAYYYRFQFADLDGNETYLLKAASVSVQVNKKFPQEKQWLALNDSTGMLVVLERNIGRGVTTRLTISNVMKSSAYMEQLDTIRYIYRPKFH
jgi:hypothetical protein